MCQTIKEVYINIQVESKEIIHWSHLILGIFRYFFFKSQMNILILVNHKMCLTIKEVYMNIVQVKSI
jgi:hypothetical protein